MKTSFPNAFVVTGNMACGKSTALNLLKMYGFSVIDADLISHEILDKNANLIAENFGENFVQNGKVNRKKLGKLVFNDAAKLRLLEQILHPKIRDEIYEKAKILEDKKMPYFVDIPLFFEKNGYDFENVVLIYVPREISLIRAMSRDNCSENEVLRRLNFQLDIEKKRALASFVIDNSGDLNGLKAQIENFIKILKDKYANLKI